MHFPVYGDEPSVEAAVHGLAQLADKRIVPLCAAGLQRQRASVASVGALIQRGGRAVAGMLTIATAGGS